MVYRSSERRAEKRSVFRQVSRLTIMIIIVIGVDAHASVDGSGREGQAQ
jgi:hypothetical protein